MIPVTHIPPGERIPLAQKLAFAVGQKTDWVATSLMTGTLWMPYFNIGLGLSPVVLGVILMILRGWDAVSDPIMGNLSDNTRTRWGRRRPFIVVGAVTTALLYPLFWYIPHGVADGSSWLARAAGWIPFLDHAHMGAGQMATCLYLTFVGIVFFTSFTVWSMPYYSLQLELTPNYDERSRLTAFMAFFTKLSNLVFGWTFMIVVLIGTVAQGNLSILDGKPGWLRSFFTGIQPWLHGVSGAAASEKPIVTGMRLMCWVIAGIILVFGIIPALFVKERYYAGETSRQATEPLWQSIRESVRCKPLWSLVGVSFFLVMGYSSVHSLGQYVNIYYVCGGDMLKAAAIGGVKGTIVSVSGICMLPVYTWLGERYDKRGIVLAMLGVSMSGHLLGYVLITPVHPYWSVVSAFFESAAVSAIWMFLPSMKADVADCDELQTARRREGSINACYSWVFKASLTASFGIGGAVLQLSGFKAGLPLQPEPVIHRMFVLYLAIPVVIWAVAFLCVWFYPLTRGRCAVIRADLEARRGVI